MDGDAAIGLEGTNGAVDVGNVLDFTGLAPFSVEAWIAPAFTGRFKQIVSKWAEPPSRIGYTLYHRDGLHAFERDLSDTTVSVVEYTGLTPGIYSHVVATFDGAELALYLNGLRVGQKPSTFMTVASLRDLMIGSGNGNPVSSPFNGSIDEVAIYGTALGAERVFAHFTAAGVAP